MSKPLDVGDRLLPDGYLRLACPACKTTWATWNQEMRDGPVTCPKCGKTLMRLKGGVRVG